MTNFSRHFQIIFDNSPIGMAILDTAGRLLYTNLAIQRMLGYSADDLHGVLFSSFLLPEDIDYFKEEFGKLAASANLHFKGECKYLPKNGEEAWWKFTITHVVSEEHSPFVFGIIEDVTNRKLGEEQLKKDKESAVQATKTKSEFLANMSHEIRTPIHTIIGMTELMLETELDEEQKEYAGQVRFSADVLLSLVNDILDFSKIEAGKLTLEHINFDFHKAVEDAVDLVSLEAHKKGLEVGIFIDRAVPQSLIGDPVRLRQIIVNLFNNAVKFTHTGEIIIRAESLGFEDGKAKTKITVKDTGIGIPAEKRERLFHAFSQVDSSTTRKYGGTGLGLSICRSLATAMGGEIGVQSESGKGSSFWFTTVLPLQSDAEKKEASLGESLKGKRILIVDDNCSVRNIFAQYVMEWGSTFDEALNGQEALIKMQIGAMQKQPYDVALIDLTMQGMDGWRLASEINADKEINSTKLILMSPTGKSGDEAKMKLLKWFDGYVTKPVKKRDLLNCIHKVANSEIDLLPVEEEKTEDVLEKEFFASGEGKGKRILVAEDHEVNQQLFNTILEKMGYQVLLASNGREAYEMVLKQPVDLIFMDVQMPEKNGYEATELIRREGIKTPIVAVTANALKGEREKCIEAGMDDYLTKPFKKADLLPFLYKWLHRGADSAPPRGNPALLSVQEIKKEVDTQVFDFEKAVETFMGKKDVVLRVVFSFVDKIEKQLALMEEALSRGDFERLRIEAHAIKGGAWNLDAKKLGDAAAALEQIAKREQTDTAAQKQEATKQLDAVHRAYLEFKDCTASLK